MRVSQDVTVKILSNFRYRPLARFYCEEEDLDYRRVEVSRLGDKSVCYPPTSVPVTWSLQVLPLDLKRSPDAIRHK